MNYTENHHLPQWAESDRIRMDDFNDAMSRIDSGIAASADTANNALALAQSAYTPDNKPFVVGSYTGDGQNQYIQLPFAPSLVIISGMTESKEPGDIGYCQYFAIARENQNVRRRVQVIKTGFHVYPVGNYDFQTPSLNEPGRLYDYIAFK